MLALDTNVLVYAANTDSEYHFVCRQKLERWRQSATPTFLTWSIVYDFLRVSTSARVFRRPFRLDEAWDFIRILLQSPGIELLTPTSRHSAVLTETIDEGLRLASRDVHDLHIAVMLREHGVSRICTNDHGFHRFPFLTVVDPFA